MSDRLPHSPGELGDDPTAQDLLRVVRSGSNDCFATTAQIESLVDSVPMVWDAATRRYVTPFGCLLPVDSPDEEYGA